jgi:hypothetical protein
VTSIRTSVYERDGATLIAHLPRRDQPQFLEELNGDGSGSFLIHLDDALLVTYPTLLDGDNVVKMTVTNAPSMEPRGWIIEEAVPIRTGSGRSGRTWAIKGRGMRARPLSRGVVYPERGLHATSGDTRAFDFSSADGPWRVTADWDVPIAVRWDLETTHRANHPSDWPDTNAYWIWSTNPEVAAAQGRNWFRTEITLGAGANVGVYAAGDNVMSVRLDGEEILASDFIDPYAWQKMFVWTGSLSAGTHTLAAWCHNTGAGNPAGFICVASTLDVDGIPATLLTRTNAADWTVHPYGPPNPGWAAGQILKKIVDESVARAEMAGAPVTLSFSNTVDTDGHAWTDIQEMTLPVSSDILSLLPQITLAGLDVEMAHDFTLNAWKRRGTDLSATLALRPGRDVEANTPSVRWGTVFNSGLMRHGTGWKLVEDATSITTNGRCATGITAGATDSETQAIQTADAFFAEQAKPQTSLPFTISSASTGPKPYVDFGLGDILTVPGVDGAPIRGRCMSIAISEPTPGLVRYEVDFYPED